MAADTQMNGQDATAWVALHRAAERVGAAAYAQQRRQHLQAGRSPNTMRFVPPEGLVALVDGMAALGRGHITAEQAMALLHEGESAEQLRRARDVACRSNR